MPRLSNRIQALDKRLKVSLTELKRDGFLSGPHQSGTLSWQWTPGHRFRLRLLIDLSDNDDEDDTTGQMELRYEGRNGPVCQFITLVRLNSNLGLGGV